MKYIAIILALVGSLAACQKLTPEQVAAIGRLTTGAHQYTIQASEQARLRDLQMRQQWQQMQLNTIRSCQFTGYPC